MGFTIFDQEPRDVLNAASRTPNCALPTRDEALLGAAARLSTSHTHACWHPTATPYPAGLQRGSSSMGCFWVSSGCVWKIPGVYTTAVRLHRRADALTRPTKKVLPVCRTHTKVVSGGIRPRNSQAWTPWLKTFWESMTPDPRRRRQVTTMPRNIAPGIYVSDPRPAKWLRISKGTLPALAFAGGQGLGDQPKSGKRRPSITPEN